MKKIILLLIVLSFACKKKEATPEPEPEPPPVEVPVVKTYTFDASVTSSAPIYTITPFNRDPTYDKTFLTLTVNSNTVFTGQYKSPVSDYNYQAFKVLNIKTGDKLKWMMSYVTENVDPVKTSFYVNLRLTEGTNTLTLVKQRDTIKFIGKTAASSWELTAP